MKRISYPLSLVVIYVPVALLTLGACAAVDVDGSGGGEPCLAPDGCDACVDLNLTAADCPALDAAALQLRCDGWPNTAPRLMRAACWSSACADPPLVPPGAVYVFPVPCELGATEPQAHLWCW